MNLFLLDGNSYFYRAYYAIKNLSTSKGLPTNAIYGFTNMILKIIREKQPNCLAMVLDSPAPTKRHKIYEAYKAQRPETPKDLIIQIPYIKKITEAFSIPIFEIPGYEADDIIGTIAKKVASHKIDVFIVTGDKDLMQVIDGNIKIYDPTKDIIIDEKYVLDRFGVTPARIPEFIAITGDPIDNIPGVKGIGEKTAKEILKKIESLDDLIDHPEKVENERIRKMLIENVENIKISKFLATIETNIPIDIDINSLKIKKPDWSKLLELFTELEFKSLIKLIPPINYKCRGEYITISDKEELLRLIRKG